MNKVLRQNKTEFRGKYESCVRRIGTKEGRKEGMPGMKRISLPRDRLYEAQFV
jgi:hypothetical protein